MKSTSLIFYGEDGDAAKVAAAGIRKEGGVAQLRHAYAFDGEKETADRIVMLPCVSAHDQARITAVYGDIVVASKPNAVLPPPPSPGPPPSPLDGLAANWKTQGTSDELKKIAAALSGRAMDNREQAVAVIEAALIARK